MDNGLISIGLDVVSVDPSPYMPNVNVNKSIRIVFNGELNENTLYGSILILEDINNVYKGDRVIDVTLYYQVVGKFAYGDKVVMFSPDEQLNTNSLYIVYIPKTNIKDILGKKMELDYISYFYTESEQTLPPCNIVFPVDGSIIDSINGVVFEHQLNVSAYLIEISKSKMFENLVIQEILINPVANSDGNIVFNTSSILLKESLYYVRVRALNGLFGIPTMFFIKSVEDYPVSIDDKQYTDIAEEVVGELEVLELFPSDNSSDIATNLNIIYIKFRGVLSQEQTKSIKCSIVGELSDDTDLDDTTKSSQGEVDGTWNIVNDYQLNESYLVCTLDKL